MTNLNAVDRRTFIKLLGLSGSGLVLNLAGCDNVTIEDGEEIVTSYVDPEDFAIPGDEVWYASTCRQCPAGCGLHARVREGRVRKLEGNPDSPVNHGRLCSMGQAGLQAHYSPDRIAFPMARIEGELRDISFAEAQQRLSKTLEAAKTNSDSFALLSGTTSGHLAVLVDALMDQLGSENHFIYEPLSDVISASVNKKVLGVEMPQLDITQASLVVSFGADFLGPWRSPVHFSAQYADLRRAPRGTLIQVEPKMTLTGANADWWLPVRAGTEGWLAMGVAHLLIEDDEIAARLPVELAQSLDRFTPEKVSDVTDVPLQNIHRLHKALKSRTPSLVLVGGPAEGQRWGSETVAAGLLLNHLLGNIGTSLRSGSEPFPQLAPRVGSTRALNDLAKVLPELENLFIFATNPVYSAPEYLGIKKSFEAVSNKVVFASQMDETALQADLLIPIRSDLEDWGSHIPAASVGAGLIQLQQPSMQPLVAEAKGLGDHFLQMLKQFDTTYEQWPDFYHYLRESVVLMREAAEQLDGPKPWQLPPQLDPPVFQPETVEQAAPAYQIERAFWEAVLARGLVQLPAKERKLTLNFPTFDFPEPSVDKAYPFQLIPSPRLSLYDGRHANLPWLQEVPDQLTTVVWDSWAEIHPQTAERLEIKEGDVLEISSSEGSLKVKAVLFAGIHLEAVAIPLGQGHEIGHYAKDVGVNPFKILSAKFDQQTDELALYATAVNIQKTEIEEKVIKLEGDDSQHNRRLVRTISVTQYAGSSIHKQEG